MQSLSKWWDKKITQQGMLWRVKYEGYIDASDTSLLHVKGIQPQMDNTIISILTLNTSLRTIRSELDGGPTGLFRERKFTDKVNECVQIVTVI